jgi:hypothetical protein
LSEALVMATMDPKDPPTTTTTTTTTTIPPMVGFEPGPAAPGALGRPRPWRPGRPGAARRPTWAERRPGESMVATACERQRVPSYFANTNTRAGSCVEKGGAGVRHPPGEWWTSARVLGRRRAPPSRDAPAPQAPSGRPARPTARRPPTPIARRQHPDVPHGPHPSLLFSAALPPQGGVTCLLNVTG